MYYDLEDFTNFSPIAAKYLLSIYGLFFIFLTGFFCLKNLNNIV